MSSTAPMTSEPLSKEDWATRQNGRVAQFVILRCEQQTSSLQWRIYLPNTFVEKWSPPTDEGYDLIINDIFSMMKTVMQIAYGAQNEAFDVEVGGFGRKPLGLRGLRGWEAERPKKRSVYIALISV